ncbi:BPSL0067 family protein [Duganella radicis]|uniref:BPSL0067 family protein n=1 Tax=Duganella radicis TaxID=551988 RepID=A0A6L6PGG7_9BURK|nr:BPSL0067 family protein [Duganella radicis]MTV37677.1 BPSL0067 family protein [Duganella radicis]
MPYVAAGNFTEPTGVLGNGQCVALVSALTGAPSSSIWREGESMADLLERNATLVPGTAIATFFKGRYPNWNHGNHAALATPLSWAAKMNCPQVAPEGWGEGQKQLESVRVLSYPVQTVLAADREYYAAPPWTEAERRGYIYQTWPINRDRAAFKYEVDCVYAGTDRYLSLEIANAKQCVARWRARPDHGVAPNSLRFSCN